MSVEIITPEELRYILEHISKADARQVIELLAKKYNMTLYNDDRYGIYRNFRKFCYLLTTMYNETVEEYLSPSSALTIFKEHERYILDSLHEYCEEDNNEFYAEVGKMFFESDFEIQVTYLVLSFIIDYIITYAEAIDSGEVHKFFTKEKITWITP